MSLDNFDGRVPKDPLIFNREKYNFEKLGSGSFGDVYLKTINEKNQKARESKFKLLGKLELKTTVSELLKSDNEKSVVKIIEYFHHTKEISEKRKNDIINEIKCHSLVMEHPQIPRIEGYYLTTRRA